MTIRQQFRYTGGLERWTVPRDLALGKITVFLAGACGGSWRPPAGGLDGGTIKCDVPVTTSDLIYVSIGQRGSSRSSLGQAAPYGGGGKGGWTQLAARNGCDGGGASDLRIGGTGLANREVVAPGGGGGSGSPTYNPGGAGGATGTTTDGDGAAGDGFGGQGGSVISGGAGGVSTGGNGSAGTLGKGGNGGVPIVAGHPPGGGGGGGWWGGGGGGVEGGGGGGSVHADGDVVIGGTITRTRGGNSATGVTGGYGYGWIEWAAVPGKPLPATPSPTYFDQAADFAVAWAFTSSDVSDAQTMLQVRYRAGTTVWTTPAAVPGSNLFYTFTGGMFAALTGQTIEWQVRVQGEALVWSAWSDSAYIVPAVKPATPTIDGGTDIESQTPGFALTAGATFTYWEGRVCTDVAGTAGAVVATSPTGTEDPAVLTVTGTLLAADGLLTPGDTYHLQGRVAQVPGVWSDWADTGPLVAHIFAPLTPTAAVTPHVDTASVVVVVTNPGSDPYPAITNLLWRTVGDAAEELLTDDIPPNGSYTDWEAPFNTPIRYRVGAKSAAGSVTSSE